MKAKASISKLKFEFSIIDLDGKEIFRLYNDRGFIHKETYRSELTLWDLDKALDFGEVVE